MSTLNSYISSTLSIAAKIEGVSEDFYFLKHLNQASKGNVASLAIIQSVRTAANGAADSAAVALFDTMVADAQTGVYAQANMKWVDINNGNDSTGNGSQAKPYSSVFAAINSITDQSSSKLYSIFVAPGTYNEDNSMVFKPYIYIQGTNPLTTFVQRTNLTQIPLVFSDNTSNSFRAMNVRLSGGMNISRGVGSTSTSNTVELFNCKATSGRFTYTGSAINAEFPSDTFYVRYSDLFINNNEFHGVSFLNEASRFGTTYFSNIGVEGTEVPNTVANLREGANHSSLTIASVNGGTQTLTMNCGAANISGNITLIGNKANFISTSETGRNQFNISLRNGATSAQFTRTTFLQSLFYFKSNSGDWVNDQTSAAGDALDELAREKYVQVNGTSVSGYPISASTGVAIVDSAPTASRISDSTKTITGTGTSMQLSAVITDFYPAIGTPVTVGAETRTITALALDSTKTITGTGTSMTLSSAVTAFTLLPGMLVCIGSDIRAISTVTSQSTFTIGAGFTSNPTAATCIIQPLGAAFTISSAFTANPVAAACTVKGPTTVLKLSAAPNFTLRVGDTITISAVAKIVTAITSQTIFTINSAFTADPDITACTLTSKVSKAPFRKAYVVGSGGPITVSANPQITAGTKDGQEIILIGTDNVNTVTLNDGTGLSLSAPIALGQSNLIALSWDSTASKWLELYRR